MSLSGQIWHDQLWCSSIKFTGYCSTLLLKVLASSDASNLYTFLNPVSCALWCPGPSPGLSASVFTAPLWDPSVWPLMLKFLRLLLLLHYAQWAHLHPGLGFPSETSVAALICSPNAQNAEAGGSRMKSNLDYVVSLILTYAGWHWLCLKN